MEKLERHIKQKLRERKIAPSAKAWNDIEIELGEVPQKTNRFPIWYMVAASVVGVLLAVLLFFKKETEQMDSQQIVDVKTTKAKDNGSREVILTDADFANKTDSVEHKEIHQTKTDQNQNTLITTGTEVAIEHEAPPVLNDGVLDQQLIIDQKVDEVLAQVRLLEQQEQSVTDAEVDSLLRAAQNDILKEQLFDHSGSVDAMALLVEVEDELNESFRDEIFNSLKERFLKLRTAVADRNN